LALRRIVVEDLDFLAGLFADPEVMRFSPGAKSRDESRLWIETTLALYESRGYGGWHLSLIATGEEIGFCGLFYQEIDGQPEVELAYRLLEPYWGQGYAPEAAAAARDLSFGRFQLTRIIALIDPQNSRSIRVAEKIGLAWEKETLKWRRRLRVYAAEKPRTAT
jgi:RimJ/RimL family protein N-acetyltransferase